MRPSLSGVAHLSLQIGSLELAVVNVHTPASADSGSGADAERQRLSHSLQEALCRAFPR